MVSIEDFSARRSVQSAQYVQERRLTASRWTENDDEFALAEVEINTAQRMHVHVAHVIDLRDVMDVKNCFASTGHIGGAVRIVCNQSHTHLVRHEGCQMNRTQSTRR